MVTLPSYVLMRIIFQLSRHVDTLVCFKINDITDIKSLCISYHMGYNYSLKIIPEPTNLPVKVIVALNYHG